MKASTMPMLSTSVKKKLRITDSHSHPRADSHRCSAALATTTSETPNTTLTTESSKSGTINAKITVTRPVSIAFSNRSHVNRRSWRT